LYLLACSHLTDVDHERLKSASADILADCLRTDEDQLRNDRGGLPLGSGVLTSVRAGTHCSSLPGGCNLLTRLGAYLW
jgi:hypothetical protein